MQLIEQGVLKVPKAGINCNSFINFANIRSTEHITKRLSKNVKLEK